MPLTANGLYRPDFEADTKLPEWMNIGGQGQDQMAQAGQAGISFVDALKQKMGNSSRVGGHDTMHADTGPMMAPHQLPTIAGGEHGGGLPLASAAKGLGGSGGGGMPSL